MKPVFSVVAAFLMWGVTAIAQAPATKVMISLGDVTHYMSGSAVDSLVLTASEQLTAQGFTPAVVPWGFYVAPNYNDAQAANRTKVVETMTKLGASSAMLITVYGDVPVCRTVVFVSACVALVRSTLSLVNADGSLNARFDEQGEGSGTSTSDAIREGSRVAIRKVVEAAANKIAPR